METIKTSMDRNGRILIPAVFRKELKMKPGSNYLVSVENDELKLTTLDKAVDEMYEIFTKHKNTENSVEQFLADRKEEFELEEKKEY